jgi:hypothetical protein
VPATVEGTGCRSRGLFSEPENDDYRRLLQCSFGDPPPLPEPFAFDLDTGDFL